MRKIRILDIFPDIYSPGVEQELKDRAALKEQLLERTNGLVELDCRCVEKGSESIECFYDAGMVVPYIVRMAEQAQKDGYDAAVLDCFMDPGLGECREYLTMPVFGVCQSACSLAMRLGGEFSVIGILEDMDRCIKENLRRSGLIGMLANIPVVDTPVLELHEHVDQVVSQIVEVGERTVREDKAKALVFGCTGMSPLVGAAREGLLARGIDVPIIEPFRAALYDAVACTLQGVAHSKRAYCPVRPKRRVLDWEQ